uniref:NADH dehydrogenase subunit 4L n=1 Tax=Mactra antiquata TaxID=2302425 RepID=R4I2V7_9BIVA|nr:NADH dehydrogenase subunit 4L [Mactra antiquata]AFC39855.1 NADH dehydrogenase subunit 4L [Mactra antiquata]AGH15611.1 TAA stop codon is completed by the addition of 3' A residues to the mRNA [Mactra antiquata]AGH15623.1 TAA stop codon is completed by the addition of 3' A residues to the mRNA [Mactra antiquata]
MCLVSGIFILLFSFSFLFSVKCHFLSVLVVLEGFNVALFLVGSFFLSEGYNSLGAYFLVFFLVFGVVEIVIGFSLLVSGSRSVSRIGIKSYSFMGV